MIVKCQVAFLILCKISVLEHQPSYW